MQTASNTEGQSAAAKSSRDIAKEGGNLADLLGSKDYGVRVKGVVLVVEEPQKVSGKSAKSGKDYSFCSRRFQLFTGKSNVVCSEMRDSLADFGAIPLYTVQEFEVESARMDGSQLVLRVKV